MTATFQSDASTFGRIYEHHVADWLTERGFEIIGRNVRHESGVEFDLEVRDWRGDTFGIECKGSPDTAKPPGMYRSDNKWKVLGYLYLLRAWRDKTGQHVRYILVTSHLPDAGHSTRAILDEAQTLGDIHQLIEVPPPAVPDLEQVSS